MKPLSNAVIATHRMEMESYKHQTISNSTTEGLWGGMLLLLLQVPENTQAPLSRGIRRLRTGRP